MFKILVLISTYNGERFIKEQIDSLLRQKDVIVNILIRDDGSSDRTLEILNEYIINSAPIEIVDGENCGSSKSFCKLLEIAYKRINCYDYFCFCDQDDVWLEDKLSTAANFLSTQEYNGKASLYMSAYQMVDAGLNVIETPIISPILNLPGAFSSNCATGCTMVFNKDLLASVIGYSSDDIIMHDYWMYLICLIEKGYIYFDSTPHILYRQHGNNVIGGVKENFSRRWEMRIKKVFKKGDNFKSKLAKKLLLAKASKLTIDDKKFLSAVATCNRLSSKILILRTKDFWKNSFDKNLQNFGLVITGKF